MAKTKKTEGALSEQANFRLTQDMHRRIERTAATLGLDMANFIRMVLAENLAVYEERAAHVRQPKEK